jgi:hypothetical protein
MNTAVAGRSPDLTALIDAVAPRRFPRDPLGILGGYRAYLVYTSLSAKGDDELAAHGVSRKDVPRLAMEVVFEGRRPH